MQTGDRRAAGPSPRAWLAVAGALIAIAVGGLLVAVTAGPGRALGHQARWRPLVGSDGHGVRAVRGPSGLMLLFSPPRYEQVAGRVVNVECDRASEVGGGILEPSTGGATHFRAPAGRAPLATGEAGRADLCSVGLVHRRSERVVAVVALTRRGALFLDQQADIRAITELTLLPVRPSSPAERALMRRLGAVRLASAQAVPPPHRLGYYSAPRHRYAAQRDRAGVRLFLQVDGTVVRTNLFGTLTDPANGGGPFEGQTRRLDY